MARATVITNIIERKRTYQWPEAQLNFWLIIMLAASATITGVFAYFLSVQNQFRVGSPWSVMLPEEIAYPYLLFSEADNRLLVTGYSPTQ